MCMLLGYEVLFSKWTFRSNTCRVEKLGYRASQECSSLTLGISPEDGEGWLWILFPLLIFLCPFPCTNFSVCTCGRGQSWAWELWPIFFWLNRILGTFFWELSACQAFCQHLPHIILLISTTVLWGRYYYYFIMRKLSLREFMPFPKVTWLLVVKPEFESRLVWIEILPFTHYLLLCMMKFRRYYSKVLYALQNIIHKNWVNVEAGAEKWLSGT